MVEWSLKKPRIVMFGGTFDPPHLGHLLCVSELKKKCHDLDRCLIIPKPQGESFGKSPRASYKDRLQMTRLLFQKEDQVLISDIESKLPSPNYTVHSLEFLAREYPNHSLGLLLGEDQYLQFYKTWKSPNKILSMCKIFVIPRSYEANSRFIREHIDQGKHFLPRSVYQYAKNIYF